MSLTKAKVLPRPETVTINNNADEIKVTNRNDKKTIYRQAAIDALRKEVEMTHDDNDEQIYYIDADNAISVIEQLPSAQPEPQWIPCSERLPEETLKSYWICTDAGYQCECRWTNINHLFTDLTMKWHWHIMDVPQYDSVVAWMPLPEPWRGE